MKIADCRFSKFKNRKSTINNRQSAIGNLKFRRKNLPSNFQPTVLKKSVAKNSEPHPAYPVHPCEVGFRIVVSFQSRHAPSSLAMRLSFVSTIVSFWL